MPVGLVRRNGAKGAMCGRSWLGPRACALDKAAVVAKAWRGYCGRNGAVPLPSGRAIGAWRATEAPVVMRSVLYGARAARTLL